VSIITFLVGSKSWERNLANFALRIPKWCSVALFFWVLFISNSISLILSRIPIFLFFQKLKMLKIRSLRLRSGTVNDSKKIDILGVNSSLGRKSIHFNGSVTLFTRCDRFNAKQFTRSIFIGKNIRTYEIVLLNSYLFEHRPFDDPYPNSELPPSNPKAILIFLSLFGMILLIVPIAYNRLIDCCISFLLIILIILQIIPSADSEHP
jgi:hypothetical protein